MKTLVYIEIKDGKVRTPSLEALAAAKQISESTTAVIVGETASLNADGIEKAMVFASDGFSPEVTSDSVAETARQGSFDAVVVAATPRGKEIAPRVAVKLEAAFLGDVVALDNSDGLKAKRSLYGGKLDGWFRAEASPVVVTTRPKMFEPASAGADVATEQTSSAEPARKSELVEASTGSADEVDLTEADVIVSGGRGMKSPENFKLLEELSQALNGVVGASRAAVDSGWRDHAEQVGQTGKVVSPQVYFAVGISGAIQHLAGMSTSKVIIAINKDPEAPIFKVADYGVVGDAIQLVPELIKRIQNG